MNDINNTENTNTITKTKGTTKSNGIKHELDKFYTKKNAVELCLSYLNLEEYDIIIEPSAGSGAFSNLIENCYAYDIHPENNTIIQADWLLLDKAQFYNKKCLIIGNPPFGNNGSLALKFIKESAKIAQTIAFILPKGFKKASIKERIPVNYHLINEIDLPNDSFTLMGVNYSVPCVFQIWERKNFNRNKITNIKTSKYFSFSDGYNADFRVQRVGGNAGKAFGNLNVSSNSNYFIKNTSSFSNEELITIFNKLIYPTINDTTGPRSISKSELIQTFENYINKTPFKSLK